MESKCFIAVGEQHDDDITYEGVTSRDVFFAHLLPSLARRGYRDLVVEALPPQFQNGVDPLDHRIEETVARQSIAYPIAMNPLTIDDIGDYVMVALRNDHQVRMLYGAGLDPQELTQMMTMQGDMISTITSRTTQIVNQVVGNVARSHQRIIYQGGMAHIIYPYEQGS